MSVMTPPLIGERTLDYVGEYTELRGGTYQELDLKSREEEHHYQRTHREKGTWKK